MDRRPRPESLLHAEGPLAQQPQPVMVSAPQCAGVRQLTARDILGTDTAALAPVGNHLQPQWLSACIDGDGRCGDGDGDGSNLVGRFGGHSRAVLPTVAERGPAGVGRD